MTEFEYLDLLSNLREEGTIQAQFFVAVFSAYILTIYFVAEKLGKVYLALLMISYSLFIAVPITASHVAVSQITAVAESYANNYPDAIVEHVLIEQLPYFNSILLVFCWFLSIVFTFSHRRDGAKGL